MASLGLLAIGVCCLVPLALICLLAAVIFLLFRFGRSSKGSEPYNSEVAEAGQILEGEYRELHEGTEGGP